jgi:uncharacterized protein YegL
MRENLAELAFILDRSGSMAGLEKDTIGGYNAMLEKQKAAQGEARITTVLFDHDYELLHDRIDLKAVSPITEKEYFVGGSTALLDAIGLTIAKISSALAHTAEEYRAKKVLFFIATDGMENASREYDYPRIKQMVERQKREHGWEFMFLGANIDAVDVAGRFGIAPDRAQTYCADGVGTRLNFEVAACAVSRFRESGEVPSEWSEPIEADFKRRGGKGGK